MSELYELPNGWEWTNFKDSLYLTDFVANGSFASLKENVSYLNKKDYAILVRLKDFSNKWNGDYVYVDKHSYDFLSKSSLNENDIMMCNVGSVGLHFRVPNLGQPMTIGPNSILIRPQIDNLSNSFLYYYFASNIFKNFLETIVATTAQPKFNKTGFKTLSIPLPPLPEQQRIVSKLDLLFEKIDKSIALHQKNMDEANAFMGSVLNDVFGELEEKYALKAIGEFSKVGTGVTPLKSKLEYYANGSINWITSKATNNEFVYEAEQLITETALNQCRLKMNPIGTLIVALYGQGKTRGQVSELKIESATNQAIATIIVEDNQSINTFLKYFFKKSYLDLRDLASGGTQPNLNLSIIKTIQVPLPPLPIQQKVVIYLDEISQKIEKIKQLQKEKMASLKALKASILDSAFRGEL